MSLPDDFSPWEHLQSVLMMTHNKVVRDQFNDLGGDEWVVNISTPRASLRTACTIRDDDSAIQCLIRMLLFYATLRGASDLHPPLYSIPTDLYQRSFHFMPQVSLYFKEDFDDVEAGFEAIDAVVSFRLARETSETMTEAKALQLANKIKSEFALNNGYRWRKGRLKASYKDKEKGYQMILTPYSETEAREVISKVLSLQGDTIDNRKFSISEWVQPPPTIPANQVIYGQSRRPPRPRPVGYVRFQWAEMHVWGINKPIILVDRTLRKPNPLVTVF